MKTIRPMFMVDAYGLMPGMTQAFYGGRYGLRIIVLSFMLRGWDFERGTANRQR